MGLEREHFLVYEGGPIFDRFAPQAKRFLDAIDDPKWTYELSAYQVESRIEPCVELEDVRSQLLANQTKGRKVAKNLGLQLVNREVAIHLDPLEVYPDPRYLEIAKNISREKLDAASRVTGTHIHIGTANIEQAIELNNALLPKLDELCRMGDHSSGERLRLYKLMAEHWQPVTYESPEHLFEVAREEGFTDNPRNCWKLIRISIHGTVELRMLGSTDDIREILEWVSFVKTQTPF